MAILSTVSRALLAAHVAAVPAMRRVADEPAPILVPQSQGCYTEPPHHEGRALKGPWERTDDMTPEACQAFCSDYRYAGVEFGRECYCGNEIAPNALPAEGECTMPCSGDCSSTCGAGDRLEIYLNEQYTDPTVATVPGFAYKGCRAEPHEDRALPDMRYEQDDMTPETCTSLCSTGGFLYAGLQWSRECWCSSTIKGGHWVADSECDMLCAGDKDSFCGAHKLNTVYGPDNVASAVIDGWSNVGCAVDSVSARVLGARQTSASDMTAATCANFCSDFAYFGLENGNECYCGHSFGGDLVDDGECALPCRGDGLTVCGDADRLSVYQAIDMPSAAVTVGDFLYLHCGADNVGDRALQGGYIHGDDITPEKCAEACADFAYFGLEFGRECYCGNEYEGVEQDEGECFKRCSGDASQLCGGPDSLSVYRKAMDPLV